MPNRILKDSICVSDDINRLSDKEEILFYRLLVQCDDYGRFDGRTSIIRSKCFPLKLDEIKDKDVDKWLTSLSKVGLIQFYDIDGKRYLMMTSWNKHQQVRSKRSKYPQPITDDINGYQMISDDCICTRESESESISESESESESISKSEPKLVINLWNEIVVDLPKAKGVTDSRRRTISSILKDHTIEDVGDVFRKVQQSEFLSGRSGKYTSCGIDWVLKPQNWMKIIEGNYDNRKPTEPPTLYPFKD